MFSVVPQIIRNVSRILEKTSNPTILLIGAGKAGITVLSTLRIHFRNQTRILVVDCSNEQLILAQKFLQSSDKCAKLNAQNIQEILQFVSSETDSKGAHMVVNCVNVPYTEASSIVAAMDGGLVLFFSMATQFDRASLGTDGLGKDVEMLIGNGTCQNQDQYMWDLLRADVDLREYFDSHTK